MRMILLRHGPTAGNLEKRYIGRTDEPLSEEGIDLAKKLALPKVGQVFASPMERCVMTAKLIYEKCIIKTVEGLRECDFGDLEGKSYEELNGDPAYQAWIDSMGTLPFPNGESPEGFKNRCISAFEEIVKTLSENDSAAIIAHGGTVMAIMEKYALPHKGFYDWSVPNFGGYICEFDGRALTVTEKL